MIRLPKQDRNFAYYRNVFARKDRRSWLLIKDETITNNKSTEDDEEGISDKY